ncbi:Cytochrome b-c1 complex subunit 10 [Ophiophagus hannah]|uniref:Cytochrome b-c1 complex subunit 10 n=1 Tax=Ophiophagus hannah TaxID=8665 RepID=V8NW56_OPHHA|nr:Cytochrome b-c1 complex subunit 10 [Ophiophagus hannah]
MAGMLALFGLKPSLLEHLRKQKGIYALWATSAVIGGVWLTDWKVILGYVPWINGKFKEDEPTWGICSFQLKAGFSVLLSTMKLPN